MRHFLFTVVPATLALAAPPAAAAEYRLSVGPLERDFAAVVLSAEIPGAGESGSARLTMGDRQIPVQLERAGGAVRAYFIAGELKKGSTPEWKLVLEKEPAAKPLRLNVDREPDNAIAVKVAGQLFTRLVDGEKAQKPYLYPILLDGLHLTRHWPMEEAPGEDHDHPHHQSFWLDHGSVNGVDFWSVGPKAGKIVQTQLRSAESGDVFARIATANEWVTPAGQKVLHDERELRFYDLGKAGRLIDVSVDLTPTGDQVTFGDTKEGTFGIRMAESMKEKRGGHIVNSRGGEGMDETWGKPAEWVDYYGKVEDRTVGIAIFDHLQSFRHPTTWHVRDYGLFAANPFGLKEFTRGKEDGTYTLKKGESMRFRFRVFLHPGATQEARVPEAYDGYIRAPAVQVARTGG